MTDLEQSVLRAIIYADCFEYALTSAQIHQYLISKEMYTTQAVKIALDNLVVAKIVLHEKDLYCLVSSKGLFRKREETETISTAKIELARKKTGLLTWMPWIDGIWITGNVAMNNAQGEDDIDLLIITRDSGVWLTRIIIMLAYGAMGRVRLRRHARSSVKNKLCLNMYLDTTALEMPSNKKNVYTAHEVAQVMPLFNRHMVYEHFLAANAWILEYLPHTPRAELGQNITPLTPTTSKRIRLINRWLFRLQYHYMKNHLSRELVDEHRAFFHPRDTSALIIQEYTKRCIDLGISA